MAIQHEVSHFDSENERLNFVVYDVDRLDHALNANIRHDIPILTERTVGHTIGGQKVSEETVYEQRGWLSTHVLEKLRAKALYSIRQELAGIGEIDLADKMIFPGGKDGEDCRGK